MVDILRRFGMMDHKSMSTPMTLNLKKLCSDESDLVDPTMYRQLIGSLMYLVNTRPDICFVVSTLSQYICEPNVDRLGVHKACAQIFTWHYWIWLAIFNRQ